MLRFYFLLTFFLFFWLLLASVLTAKEFKKLSLSIPFPDIHLHTIYTLVFQMIGCALGGIGAVAFYYYMYTKGFPL